MKSLLLSWFLTVGVACAQTPVPAEPADPDQPHPAVPVLPSESAPIGPVSNGASVTVLADSSLKGVLQALAQAWADSRDDGPQVPLLLTNAATMRSRLQANPATDVVIDADLDDVKAMTDQGLLMPDGQRSLARNTLVIFGRAPLVSNDSPDWFDLIGDQWKKVAIGNPDLTVSGRVARHALQKHDLFDDAHKSIYVLAGTEEMALQKLEQNQADAVFLYRTDLVDVSLPGFDVFPLSSEDAPPVFYTAAIGRLTRNPAAARSFLDYCVSDAAREIWKKFGFETN